MPFTVKIAGDCQCESPSIDTQFENPTSLHLSYPIHKIFSKLDPLTLTSRSRVNEIQAFLRFSVAAHIVSFQNPTSPCSQT